MSALLVARLATGALAGNDMGGIPDTAWPASWLRAPSTASEVGIQTFHESPMLTAQVLAGDLPPVRERLPDDPVVIEPYDRIGTYGGTLRVFTQGASRINNIESPVTMCPQVSQILPNWASGWEYSDDARTFTLYLRPGLRWSDGAPLTAADFVWRHKHELMNEHLTPVVPPRQQGMIVEAPDPLTVVFRFREPYAFMLEELAHRGETFVLPGHFLQNYHPDFRDPDELILEARAAGYISWMAYFNVAKSDGFRVPVGTPVLRAYRRVRRSPTLIIFERNPYYHKVDPAGNQLPYIDRIQAEVASNPEVISAKVSTGQMDFAGSTLQTQDIPLYMVGQQAYGYRTLVWNRLHGVDVVIKPNLTIADPALREVFRDIRFRKALSLAINRDEINDIVYFGQGTPRQTTVIPSSRYFEPSFAEACIEYAPDKARALLDAMGLRDFNGDGIRSYPDGSQLVITLEWHDIETPKGPTMELVTSHWLAVGIDVRLRLVNAGLQSARARSNAMQMSVWHADRSTDILFPLIPSWFVPMYVSWDEVTWTEWSRWYLSGGQSGEKPIPAALQLIDWWDEMRMSADPDRRIELGKNILASHAEHLWTIGTIGLAPQPVVISRRLQNVSTRGWWGWDNLWLLPYHTPTWFLEEVGEVRR